MGVFNQYDCNKPQKGMNLARLRDGFDMELRKLRAIEAMICFAGEEDCMSLTLPDVKEGISYILNDIGRAIEDGLDGVETAVEAKILEAVAETKCPDPSLHTDFVRIPFYGYPFTRIKGPTKETLQSPTEGK